jgi:phage pi2 protein 07
MYTNKKYNDWDFRTKNMIIYLTSDFMASFGKIMFEARKQTI